MSPSDPPPELGLSWRMREHEARLLADSLRTSRLTLLYAGAGASRSELLSQGVVPLLGRREADLSTHGFRESRVVAPFIDRRSADVREGEGAAQNERVVYFCDWGDDPLPALLAAIRSVVPDAEAGAPPNEPLADLLERVCERLDARLLIVLDAFERFWGDGSGTVEAVRFVEAFGEAVDRPRLRVNFLLAVDDRFEGRLDALRRAVRGFDDSTVRLLGFERGGVGSLPDGPRRVAPPPASASGAIKRKSEPPMLSDVVVAVRAPVATPAPSRSRRARPPKVPLSPSVPIKADGVYAFIESTLTLTADASEPWHEVDEKPRTAPVAVPGAGRDPSGIEGAAANRAHVRPPATVEPPSPIDEWLDAAIAWCRRLLKSR